jgi:hypothetical protein
LDGWGGHSKPDVIYDPNRLGEIGTFMKGKISIEVREQYSGEPVCCPFCGFRVFPGDQEAVEEWCCDPKTCVCKHVLFVATDCGFEYRSSAFSEHMGWPDDQSPEPDCGVNDADGWDALTSTVTIPDAVKIACYSPSPSFFGVYYGFAPRG